MYIQKGDVLCPNSDDNLVGESGNEDTNVNMSELNSSPLTSLCMASPCQHSSNLALLASKTNAIV